MRREAGVFPSQLVLRYEQRMMTSVQRITSTLASDIDARWAPEPAPMIAEHLDRWRVSLEALIYRFSEVTSQEAILHIYRAAGVKSALEQLMLQVRHDLRYYSSQKAAAVEGALRELIMRKLSEGRSLAEARREVNRILTNPSAVARIARSVIHTAAERGLWEAANSLGVRMSKTWISREDDRVRPAHAAAHGQVREISDPFLVGGEAMMFPGDPAGSAHNTVNCRCTVNYSFG